MNAKQYTAALKHLGLTQLDAAKLLGVSLRSSNSYANGAPVPMACRKLLRLMIRLDVAPKDVR